MVAVGGDGEDCDDDVERAAQAAANLSNSWDGFVVCGAIIGGEGVIGLGLHPDLCWSIISQSLARVQ